MISVSIELSWKKYYASDQWRANQFWTATKVISVRASLSYIWVLFLHCWCVLAALSLNLAARREIPQLRTEFPPNTKILRRLRLLLITVIDKLQQS